MRVHYVQSARKAKKERSCRRCGHKIQPGESYKWAEPRYGPILLWCKDHSPKRSELTSSKLGPLYDAQDDFDVSEMTSAEEISEALNSVAEVAREVAEEYQEGIDNMPEGLQEGDVAQQSQEKIEALESFADELESWEASDVEEFDEDEAEREAIEELIAENSDEINEEGVREHLTPDLHDRIQQKRDEWDAEHGDDLDAVREEAMELVNGLEV